MPLQVRTVLDNIQLVLAHVGGEMNDIIPLTQYLTDIDAFIATGSVRSGFFQAPFQVTTTVEVSRHYHPDLVGGNQSDR